MINYNDHYQLLGINSGASFEELRTAYKKLALDFHPDKHPETEKDFYTQKFLDISNAYEILAQRHNEKTGPSNPTMTESNPSEYFNQGNYDKDNYQEVTSVNDILFFHVLYSTLTKEKLDELLNKGANINYVLNKGENYYGRSLLHLAACKAGHDFDYNTRSETEKDKKIDIVAMLLEKEAEPTSLSSIGSSILRDAIGYYSASYREKLVQLLVDKGAPICNGKVSALDYLTTDHLNYMQRNQPETYVAYSNVRDIFRKFILTHPEDQCATAETREILGIPYLEIDLQ